MDQIERDKYWECVKSIASEAYDLQHDDKRRFIEESVSGSEYTTYALPILVCLYGTQNRGAYLGADSFRDLAYTSGDFTALAGKVAYYAMLADVWGKVATMYWGEEDDGV